MTGVATVSDRAYSEIRRCIVGGIYAEGAHLKEEELAERLGVSRTPIREALRRLNAEGLVDFVPNQGVYVAPWDKNDFEEIIELRALLEGYGVELAARKITQAQIDELRGLAAEMEETAAQGGPDMHASITELNRRFHRIICLAAGNRRLEPLLSGLVEVPLVMKTFHQFTGSELQRSMNHHRDLIDALSAGDPVWAGAVMRSHILAARSITGLPRPVRDAAE